jgi:tRNA G18 (ribose-2'-O)-methylase SpoU
MPLIDVNDPGDSRIADYRNVPDRELLERRRLFVAEGRLVVRRLLTASPLRTRSAMVTEAGRASMSDILPGDSPLPIYVVSQAVMNGVTGFNLHRGCLAIGERPAPADWRALAAGARRIVVLERVGNADNVGGIFRSAAAFAADAVLLGPGCADPLYRKAIRTSMAATLTLPFATIEPWPEGCARCANREARRSP